MKFDVTFIIFHCGSYERIGFRHRDSQTLFLSDLIDVPGGSDPAYGKLQVGVYMVVLRDVLDRIRQIRASTDLKAIATKGKRTRDSKGANLQSKKLKTRSATFNKSKTKEPVEDTPLVCYSLYIFSCH